MKDYFEIVYFGRNINQELTLLKSLESEEVNYYNIRSQEALEDYITEKDVHCLVVDDDSVLILKDFLDKIYRPLIRKNPKAMIFFLYDIKNKIREEMVRESCYTIFLDKVSLHSAKYSYLFEILMRKKYRTVIVRDLKVNQSYSRDLYYFRPSANEYSLVLKNGMELTTGKLSKLYKEGITHIFCLNENLKEILNDSDLPLTQSLDKIRRIYRFILVNLIDDHMILEGEFASRLSRDLKEMVKELDKMSNLFPNTYDCLTELPYNHWGRLAHGLNMFIYSYFFCDLLKLTKKMELCEAALLHDIGLCEVEKNVVSDNYNVMSRIQRAYFHSHVEKSLEFLMKRKYPLNAASFNIIKEHHEHFDGTGGPYGLIGESKLPESDLFKILDSLDHIRTNASYEVRLDIKKGMEEVCKNQKSSPLGAVYNLSILDKITRCLK